MFKAFVRALLRGTDDTCQKTQSLSFHRNLKCPNIRKKSYCGDPSRIHAVSYCWNFLRCHTKPENLRLSSRVQLPLYHQISISPNLVFFCDPKQKNDQ